MNALLRTSAPIAVRTVELSEPLAAIDGVAHCDYVRVYFLWEGVPLACADVPNHGRALSAARLLDIGLQHCTTQILARTLQRQLGADAPARVPSDVVLSVVVATLDRPDALKACLDGLVRQNTTRPVEIVVVDNNPDSGLTPPVVQGFPGVLLVREARRGLSYARNAGILACRGAIIACTDDDVVVPPGWADAIVAPFADPAVMAVTGNVLPLELEERAQRLYEVYGGLGRGFDRRTFDASWFRQAKGAVPTWNIGATANAAFRAEVFADPSIGMLEESLGAGMPAGVGEDTYLFYRILKAGHPIVYEPSAYLWHSHRRTMAALRQQVAAYSRGHVAYHLTTLTQDDDKRALRRFASLARWHARQLLRWAVHRVRGRPTYPLSLILTEIRNNMLGPWAYLASRRIVRRLGRSSRLARSSNLPKLAPLRTARAVR